MHIDWFNLVLYKCKYLCMCVSYLEHDFSSFTREIYYTHAIPSSSRLPSKFDVRRHGAHASVPVEMASPHTHVGHHHVLDWVEKNLWPVELLFWGHTSFLIPTGELQFVNHRPLLVKLRVHWPDLSKLTKNRTHRHSRTIASIQHSHFTGVNPVDVLKQD